MCVCVFEGERERVCVRECVCLRGRERVRVCVRECVCLSESVCERERLFKWLFQIKFKELASFTLGQRFCT